MVAMDFGYISVDEKGCKSQVEKKPEVVSVMEPGEVGAPLRLGVQILL